MSEQGTSHGSNGASPQRGGDPPALVLLRAAPAVARFGFLTARNLTQWGLDTSLNAALRVARAASIGETPAQVLEATFDEVRDRGRRILGIPELEDSVRAAGASATASASNRVAARTAAATPASLRARGAELLRLSADVNFAAQVHPAYARILEELAPDEARILRKLALDGPQAIVDVRTGRPIGSQLVERGLTMIGTEAGCAHLDRVSAYLDNLARLGLLRVSVEPLTDALRYQVLEVQPEVMEARKRGGHGRTVRRSIHLTTFGTDFCAVCLPLESAEVERLAPPQPQANGSEPAP
ncbi:MAG TPA: Abi-alpha family protein [Candidatus Dormibacteraeota bacterium]|nr:Abi-alpha family protein [Candidatus Dormibacteraeota bacterium]